MDCKHTDLEFSCIDNNDGDLNLILHFRCRGCGVKVVVTGYGFIDSEPVTDPYEPHPAAIRDEEPDACSACEMDGRDDAEQMVTCSHCRSRQCMEESEDKFGHDGQKVEPSGYQQG